MSLNSAVLFLIFNRPDTCARVFQEIRKQRPPRLYIAADGPRPEKASEPKFCADTRAITESIDWDCKVSRLYRETNLGCKIAVSSAIDWFFQNEEEGIILEDDCLPSQDFFRFCNSLLEYYRHDTRVRAITGSNLQQQKWGPASYYFSACSNIWGWATWKRTWNKYEVKLDGYEEEDAERMLRNTFTDQFVIAEWMEIFRKMKRDQIDTWDYQFHLINFFENGLSATPNVNLVSNIGFRSDGTHTHDPSKHSANIPIAPLGEIIHPTNFVPEKEADQFLFRKEFYLDEKWAQYEKNKLFRRRAKKWLSGFFNKG